MSDFKEDFINKIVFTVQGADGDISKIKDEIFMLFNDVDVHPKQTLPAVRDEDKNEELIRKFIIAKTVSGRSERTVEYYRKTLIFVNNKIKKNFGDITTDDIRLYLAYRQRRDHIKKITANDELRVLKSFYGFMSAEDIINPNPCIRVEQIKQDKVQRKAFPEIEIEEIRQACKTSMQQMIVEILLSTGCRVSEIAGMKISELEGNKMIVHGKGNKDRTVYLNAKATLAVQKYLSDRTDKNPWLLCGAICLRNSRLKGRKGNPGEWYKRPERITEDKHMDKSSIEGVVRLIGKNAGVPDVHPHRFRRTCATLALRRGMPIEQVSKMLGHEQLSTTQIYLDLSEEDLARAHEKYII